MVTSLWSLYTFRIQSVFLLFIKYTHDYPHMCEIMSSHVLTASHYKLCQPMPFKEMENGAHQEDSTLATSGSRCWTLYVRICHLPSYKDYFFVGHFSKYLVYLVLTVIILRLISHNNRIKTSAFIHLISLATFTIVMNTYVFILCMAA